MTETDLVLPSGTLWSRWEAKGRRVMYHGVLEGYRRTSTARRQPGVSVALTRVPASANLEPKQG